MRDGYPAVAWADTRDHHSCDRATHAEDGRALISERRRVCCENNATSTGTCTRSAATPGIRSYSAIGKSLLEDEVLALDVAVFR
jgi:hypothetical protein